MISITITDNNAARTVTQLGTTSGWRKPMTQSLALLQDDIAEYPAPPAGSTYRRTGNLGRAWTSAQYEIDVNTGGATGVIGNAVRDRRGRAYGPFVQEEGTQASIHQGRWSTDQDVAERNTPAIVRIWAAWFDDQG